MRGAPADGMAFPGFDRIIPAYAGSTLPWGWVTGRPGDHPRVCGEHPQVKSMVKGEQGSSPRMRGARPGSRVGRHRGRIIPAYAGSTSPHLLEAWQTGSSPRMRGALVQFVVVRHDFGIIPAYAGSTMRRAPG